MHQIQDHPGYLKDHGPSHQMRFDAGRQFNLIDCEHSWALEVILSIY